jgi:hypothetical protein
MSANSGAQNEGLRKLLHGVRGRLTGTTSVTARQQSARESLEGNAWTGCIFDPCHEEVGGLPPFRVPVTKKEETLRSGQHMFPFQLYLLKSLHRNDY